MHPHPGKDRIVEALVDLLQTRKIEDIPVKLLIATAGVNKSSYYYNFRKIQDVADCIMGQFIAGFHKSFSRYHRTQEAVMGTEGGTDVFRFFYDNRRAYTAILNGGLRNEFNDLLITEMYEEFASYDNTYVQMDGTRVKLPADLKEYFLLSSCSMTVAYLESWARHSFDKSPEELMDMMLYLLDLRGSEGTIEWSGSKSNLQFPLV